MDGRLSQHHQYAAHKAEANQKRGVSLVAMTPLITIQLLGFGSLVDRRAKEHKAMKRILDADDQQIINFM